MKKILVAIDNEEIYNEIKKEEKYDVCDKEIIYKEAVLEYIAKNKVDVIITRDDLEGDMIKEIYIKQIKLLNPEMKIILFVKELETKYLEFLYSNEIFNIIEQTEEFDIKKIVNMIDGDVVYQLQESNCNIKKNMPINVVTKKKIAVFGTNGSGKSYISTLLTEIISENLNMNTLLIDMDVQSSAIDIYNNLNCSNNLLMDIIKDVDNQTITTEGFLNNVYTKGKKNYITNNASIFDYQNNLCVSQYEKIFQIASTQFDVLISDVPGNILLDISYYNLKNADAIMFVINPNYISIRQAIKYLDLITNSWNIDRNRIHIIVNKVTKNSLSLSQIEALLVGYKISMEVEYDDNIENIINGVNNVDANVIKEDKEIYKIFGVNKEERSIRAKYNFIYNFFKKGENT